MELPPRHCGEWNAQVPKTQIPSESQASNSQISKGEFIAASTERHFDFLTFDYWDLLEPGFWNLELPPHRLGECKGAGRRELTRQQAKLMVAIREAKRAAKREGKPPPKIDRKTLALLRKPAARRR